MYNIEGEEAKEAEGYPVYLSSKGLRSALDDGHFAQVKYLNDDVHKTGPKEK